MLYIAPIQHIRQTACHVTVLQIFGVDILLDDTFRAWLIEVNTGPDLSSTSPLDKQLKHKMVAQMMHLVGVIPYDRYQVDGPPIRMEMYGNMKAIAKHLTLCSLLLHMA